MSEITVSYTRLITIIETALSSYKRLPNPYDAESNAFQLLKKGYGIAFGGATNTERYVSCNNITTARDFSVVLVNQVTASDNNTSARQAIELSLMEDQFALISAVTQDADLQGGAFSAKYLTDTGIQLLQAENSKARFYATEVTFEVEYRDTF